MKWSRKWEQKKKKIYVGIILTAADVFPIKSNIIGVRSVPDRGKYTRGLRGMRCIYSLYWGFDFLMNCRVLEYLLRNIR